MCARFASAWENTTLQREGSYLSIWIDSNYTVWDFSVVFTDN